jgi:hypothetical protein
LDEFEVLPGLAPALGLRAGRDALNIGLQTTC